MSMFHSVPGVPRGKVERFGGPPGSSLRFEIPQLEINRRLLKRIFDYLKFFICGNSIQVP